MSLIYKVINKVYLLLTKTLKQTILRRMLQVSNMNISAKWRTSPAKNGDDFDY